MSSVGFDILRSVIISYVIIKIFNSHPYNNLESPSDYFDYYIVNNVKDIIKTILAVPIIFLIFRFFNKKTNSDELRYNTSIIKEIIKELYFNFITIAKAANKTG